MNTWLTDLVYDTNERFFNKSELDRLRAYYGSLPGRLRAIEELEKLEPRLEEDCQRRLRERFPDRSAYTPRLVRDVIESLRLVGQAMLADEPNLVHHRLAAHLQLMADNLGLAAEVVRAPYEAAREQLSEQMSPQSFAVIDLYLGRLLDALGDSRESARTVTTL